MNNWNVRSSWEGNYLDICEKAVNNEKVFKTFKRHPHYLKIVNQMTNPVADEYYEILKGDYPYLLREFKMFQENDAVGSPITYRYDKGNISGAILMYMKVLGDIHDFIGNDFKTVCEIGAGFGGQAKVICDYHPSVHKYYLYDRDIVLKLQKKYLNLFKIKPTLMTLKDSIDPFDLLIANFSWSELSQELKNEYIIKVIMKAKHGYISANCDDKIGIDLILPLIEGKKITILDHIPGKGRRPGKILIWK
jgi:hypothetical protein